MEAQKNKNSLPTLRIYFWDRPSITAGYFQDLLKIARRYRVKEKRIPLVRRPTGGGLVLHNKDLTFSLTLKNPNPYLPKDIKASYQAVNEALYEGLHRDYALQYVPSNIIPSGRGLDARACFEKPTCFDLLWKGKKAVGASQRRKDGAILHQSAVFLAGSREKMTMDIVRGFEKRWKICFFKKGLTRAELAKAILIEKARYQDSSWQVSAKNER